MNHRHHDPVSRPSAVDRALLLSAFAARLEAGAITGTCSIAPARVPGPLASRSSSTGRAGATITWRARCAAGRRLAWCAVAWAVAVTCAIGPGRAVVHAQTVGLEMAPPRVASEPGPGLVTFDDSGGFAQPAGPAPTPRHTGIRALIKDLVSDVAHLPSKENFIWAGVGGGLALAVHPADDNVNRALVDSSFAHDFFKPGAILGQSYTLFAASAVVYTIGRWSDRPKVSHMGMDLIQALVISEGLTQIIKTATRRERPDGSGNNSFPSGHAADTFAFATALERHLGWKGAIPAYIFASYVAMSRLPANRHWLSDVAFGTSVGIIAGRTVTRHGRPFPVAVQATPGGVAVVYTR